MKDRLQKQFERGYNREEWQRTLLEIFGVREIAVNPVLLEDTEKAKCYELGRHMTADGYEIGVFEYEMKEGQSVEKGRIGLRNLVKSYLKYHIDAALVVYHDSEHWRLSFICDLKGEKTDPKRFTYIFGYPDQSYKTPVERFSTLADSEATFENIFEAFSVKKLDDDFFNGYKELYKRFCKSTPNTVEFRNFIKLMMGRIVFLYFLQKKGWLGEDRNYMNNLLERSKKSHKNTFLSEVLGVLFFDTLNERRDGDAVDPILGEGVKIPYLNGGLFERGELDRVGVDFKFDYFEKLFAFFSSFNFTVDENAHDDAEVGVDPEMLGHIFENLLEDNKSNGAYYTPKEVVDYMCKDALAQFLKRKLPDLHSQIDAMIYRGDVSWLDLENEGTKTIIDLIKEVKICDPAIGSGAFPMGMLDVLYEIRRAIYDHFGQSEKVTSYTLKRDIVLRNIHGVDLDQGAVDIARLRFWLALVVDDTEQRPLPNLDYKIMQGNSLIESYKGTNLSLYIGDGKEPYLHNKDGEQGLLRAFFGEDYHDRKAHLRDCIKKKADEHCEFWLKGRYRYLVEELQENPTQKPFFLWNLYFMDVFSRAEFSDAGFDIVIGNPPYGATYTAYEKQLYARQYWSTRSIQGRQKGSQDTYTMFIEQGFQLAAKDGVVSFIVPISITSGDSVTAVQGILLKHCETIKISSYADSPKPVFENAAVATSIISFVKTKTRCESIFVSKMHRRGAGVSLKALLSNHKFIEASDFVLRGRFPKISEQLEKEVLSKIFKFPANIGKFIRDRGEPIFYRSAGGRYYEVVTNYSTGSTAEKAIYFDKHIRDLMGAILSSSLFFWYYQVYSDIRNLKSYEIESFPFPIEDFSNELIEEISVRYEEYLKDIESNMVIRQTKAYKNITSFKEYKISKSKAFIDRLDDLICPIYGLSEEETEFIKSYEIEFRMPESQ